VVGCVTYLLIDLLMYLFTVILQIPVHVDLPSVGHNLQDHIAIVGLEYLLTTKIGSSEQKSKSLMALFDYFVFGKGDSHMIFIFVFILLASEGILPSVL